MVCWLAPCAPLTLPRLRRGSLPLPAGGERVGVRGRHRPISPFEIRSGAFGSRGGPKTSPPQLTEWHDYFMILGTASATLIGAMFVVVSIGTGFLTRDRSIGIRTFLTSTVTNLSATLFGAALTMVPALDWLWLGGIAGVVGIAGLVY